MRARTFLVTAGVQLIFCLITVVAGQEPQTPPDDDVVATLVGRLELEQFKGTLEGLTQFGDRAQGTQRNRDAVDWIEARLQAVGCTSTGRVSYEMPPRPVRERSPARVVASCSVTDRERAAIPTRWPNPMRSFAR